MNRPPSISRRLVFGLTGCVIALWLAATGGGAYMALLELEEELDAALQETAQRLLPLAVDDLYRRRRSDGSEPREIPEATVAAHYERYLTYQLRDRDGRVLLKSHDASSAPFDAPLTNGFVNVDGFRTYTEPSIGSSIFLQVSEPLAHRREAITEIVWGLLLPLIALIPFSLLGTRWIVTRSLKPIEVLQETVSARNGSNLAPIEMKGLPVELTSMAHAVDRLLVRLRRALEAERSFAANSAHELRTPISIALAQTQRLIAEVDDGPAKDRATEIERALRRLGNLASKLMQLSRADSGISLSGSGTDALPALRLVVEEFSHQPGPARQIVLDDDAAESRTWRIDIDAFGIAIRNLIENAIIHGDPDTPVHVTVDRAGDVHVVNSGPVVPKEMLARLKNRFDRGLSRAGGSGLGLAIAETIMRQTGGELVLLSPATGRDDGFEAILRFGS